MRIWKAACHVAQASRVFLVSKLHSPHPVAYIIPKASFFSFKILIILSLSPFPSLIIIEWRPNSMMGFLSPPPFFMMLIKT